MKENKALVYGEKRKRDRGKQEILSARTLLYDKLTMLITSVVDPVMP